jgi:hypothetical protein
MSRKIVVETAPVEERIRNRAYELYLLRGGEDGSDMEDWLQAETEIQAAQQPVAQKENK